MFSALLAAEPWHYWLAFALVGLAVLAVVAVVAGYFIRVTSMKYPKGRTRR